MRKSVKMQLERLSNLSLEHRIFIMITLIGTIFSFFTAFINAILGLGLVNVIASFIIGVIAIIVIIVSIKRNTFKGLAIILFIVLSFIFYPTVWITSGGSQGTVPMFYLMNLLFIPIVLDKKTAPPMMVINILVVGGLLSLEGFFPEIITAYPNVTARMIDVSFVTVLLCVSAFAIGHLLIVAYNKKFTDLNELSEKLELLSVTDELTGLYNRRYIKDILEKVVKNNEEFSVIMVDIDDFKIINDTYGHSVGDKVIVGTANSLNNNLESNQIVGRIGGEEFLIIIKEKYNEKIYHFAEFLRLSIEELKYDGIDKTVTISLGTYTPKKNDSIDKILVEVDKRLYEAKDKGKNIVISSN